MIEHIFTAAFAFVVTNLDDLVLGAFFFSGAKNRKQKAMLVLGKYAGMGILLIFSLLGAWGMGIFPGSWQRLLGFVPIFLALRAWLERKKEPSCEKTDFRGGGLEIMLLTLSCGGDNLGVYIPLLLGKSPAETGVMALTFMAMTGLFCFLSLLLLKIPGIRKTLETYQGILTPLVYLILGIYVLIG